jgi:hypothetical protein
MCSRCAGIVSPADHGQLLALLKGMCTRRHELEENEYGMVGSLLVGDSCGDVSSASSL